MSKIQLNKNCLSMNLMNLSKNQEAFEERVKEIAPEKVKKISEILSVNTVKRNFIFSKKIFKLKKKSESVDLVKYSDFRLKEEDIKSILSNFDKKLKINLKKFQKLKEENEDFQKKYNTLKQSAIRKKNISSVLNLNPEITFSDLIRTYNNKGYKIPDLSVNKNLFNFSPLLINKKTSSTALNDLNKLSKNDKSIKYMEKLNSRISERQTLNKKNNDNDSNKRVGFILRKFPTLNTKNENIKTEVGTEIEIEKIEGEIKDLREIEKKLNKRKSIRLKKENLKKNSKLQIKNKSISSFDITADNFNNQLFVPKSSYSNNRTFFKKNFIQNNNFDLSLENFSKLNSNFNSNLNSGHKTCADSENISKFGNTVSKFEIEKSKKFKRCFNSEYLNYALNSVNLDGKKIENKTPMPGMTHSFFYDLSKKEATAKDLYDKLQKYSHVEEGLNENFEDLKNYFKDKINLIKGENKPKDLLNNISEINFKLDQFNTDQKFYKTNINGFNFNVNADKIKNNNHFDKKIKKLDKEVVKKISLWNNLEYQ